VNGISFPARILGVLAIGTVCAIIACGGGGSSSSSSSSAVSPTAGAGPLALSLETTSTNALDTVVATAAGANTGEVAWTVDAIPNGNATVGTISGSGSSATYTAPAAAGAHTVAVTDLGNASSASSVIQVISPPMAVTLAPATPSLAPGGTVSLSATLTGSRHDALQWLVDGIAGGNAATGTLAGSGTTVVYTAPSAPGSHHVTVTSAVNPAVLASATVAVQGPGGVTVTPTFTSASINTNATLSITVAVSGTANTAVTWAVDGVINGNSTVGTITGSGDTVTYRAPAAAGSHVVVASSVANALSAASITISALAPAALALSPASCTLAPSQSQSFTAVVQDSSNTAVTWTVDGIANGNATVGAISGSGYTVSYAAPAALGSHTVAAHGVTDNAVASATVVIATPVVVSLALPLASPTRINVSGAMLLSATVTGASNTAVTWTVDGVVNGNASLGAVTAPGPGNTVLFTAPATVGSHLVTASSVADPTRSASTTINVASATVQVATPALVVNVRSAPYNAKGDGITDDTAAIQAAVNAVAGTGGEVTIPAGTYLINPIANNGNAGIALGSSMTLNLEDGAVLQARSTATSGYVVLQLNGVHDVNLTGGTVLGNRDNNTITDTVEAGMGIQVKASRHVVVENMNVSNCWADGIYVVAASQDVTISQVVANNNRRNGMSIVSVSDMVVRGCTFENATGSMENGAMANGGGIDVEPNPGDTIDTVLFAGCSFRNNAAGGLGASVPVANTGLAFTRNIYVVGNTVSGNPYRGINVSNFSDAVVVNNTVTGNGQYGILFQTQATNAVCTGNSVTGTTGVPGNGIDEDSCSGNLLTGNTCTGNAGHGLVSAGCTGGAISGNTLSGNGIAP